MIVQSSPARFRRLPARWAGFVMPLILSVLMTFVVSAVATWRSLGFHPDLPATWMSSWGLSWLVAFPTLLLVLPLVRRIVAGIVEPPV